LPILASASGFQKKLTDAPGLGNPRARYVARRRNWPLLSVLSLAGTLFYQVAWIGARMGPERLVLGLGILGVFATVFAVAGRLAGSEEEGHWLTTQAGGIGLESGLLVFPHGCLV